MMKRRQNHSCEQCRKSKKACDGHLVNSGQAHLVDAALSGDNPNFLLPCSYCLRTKKACSLNPHWAKQHEASPRQRLTDPEDSGLDDGQPQAKRQRQAQNDKTLQALPIVNDVPCLDSLVQLLQTSPRESDFFGWDRLSAPDDHPSITSPNPGGPIQAQQVPEGLVNLEQLNSIASRDDTLADRTLDGDLDGFANPDMPDCSPDSSNFSVPSIIPGFFQGLPTYTRSMSSTSSQTEDKQRELRRDYRESKDSMNVRDRNAMSLSPFGADHLIMENSNKNLISDNLLHIYHDVLENNLACWLAEDTCPYKLQQRRCESLAIQQNAIAGTQSASEWGIAWSNRMYRRVRQLDRSAQSARLIRLAAHESQATSKALNLAVMAFSTQWAQVKRRCDNLMGPEEEDLRDEFEQILQQSVWEQARRAIQRVSNLECFSVVFAELIFGLVQKPSSSYEYDLDANIRPPGNPYHSVKTSVVPEVMDMISREEPPIFMERAARKIHALKYRFEAHQAGFQQGTRNRDTELNPEGPHRMSSEEGQTIGFLYWLAVMFDTVSASIYGRPVVVPDEECQHDAAPREVKDHMRKTSMDVRWKLDLYAQENTERPSLLHWPCPYEVATSTVARSAVVKVLLHRHVSYLQKALRNFERGLAIEEIIKSTLSVYRYWDRTHGAFFRDLIKHYDSVPARIRSWFPCISIPWHLGSLLLADLIDAVDENHLGCDGYREKRLHVGLAMKIRKASSIELADLAAVMTPQDVRSMELKQLPDFHFAVNESPVLTEPWTVLLIRAFTKASLFHMCETEELRNQQWFDIDHNGEALQVSNARAEKCIRALQFLGRKSGMAGAVGIVLSRSLGTCGGLYESGHLSSQVRVV